MCEARDGKSGVPGPQGSSMLEIRDLHVRYGGIQAVQGVSLNIPRGSIVTLIGANGAGKSSIIRSIAGLNKTVSGEILLTRQQGEKPVSLMGLNPEDMVLQGISLSPEGRRILPHLTVEENLRLGAYTRSDQDAIDKDIQHVYSLFPRLMERHWQKGGTLSGGEQQMLAVGRALMSRPEMLMLDEPSLGLAPLLVRSIFETVRAINQKGVTVLLVEQNARAALRLASRGYVLEVGRVVMEDQAQRLLADASVREAYLGG